jgi:Rod binding domain-containing protein
MAVAPPSLTVLPPKPENVPADVQKVAQEFEAVFLAELLTPVFAALETEGIGGGGAGERAFRPLLVQEYAKAIAARGGVGVTEAVTRELLRIQGDARV